MSFLLLKSRSGRASSLGRQRGGNANSNPTSTSRGPKRISRNPPVATASSKLNHSRQTQGSTNAAMAASGNGQVQLQRQPVHRLTSRGQREHVSQRNRQDNQRLARQQERQNGGQQQQQQDENEVICMDEVMEDLRILERQQHESQRHLESIKMSKQHKIEQRSALEKKLSSLKYATGQAKEELLRSREVLSTSNRELGVAKLASEKYSEKIKKLDGRLKRTIGIVRELYVKRRKVSSALVKLRGKAEGIKKRKTEMHEQVESTRMQLDDAKHEEQLLVKSTQASKMKSQHLALDISRVRSEVPALEEELVVSREMETSTKVRMESLATEIQTEDQRHDKAMVEAEKSIADHRQMKIDLDASLNNIKSEISGKKSDLDGAWKKCMVIQKDEGHELSPSAEGAKLDLARVQQSVHTTDSQLREEQRKKQYLENSVNNLNNDISSLKEQSKEKRDAAAQLLQSVNKQQKIEDERVQERKMIMVELDDERNKHRELKSSVEELEKESQRISEAASEVLMDQMTRIDSAKDKLKSTTVAVLVMKDTLDLLKLESRTQTNMDCKRVQNTKHQAGKAKEDLENIQVEVEEFSNTPDREKEKELQHLVQEHHDFMESSTLEGSKLTAKYPFLKALDLDFNPDIRVEDQVNTSLSNLRSIYEQRLNTAREERETRVQTALKKKQEDIDMRKKLEEESRRKREEEELRIKMEEEARKKREMEEILRIKMEKEAREKREEEEAEALRIKMEEEARIKREKQKLRMKMKEEARKKREEEAEALRIKLEEEARQKRIQEEADERRNQEEQLRQEADLKKRIEAEKRHQNEIRLKKKLEDEARKKIQEEEKEALQAKKDEDRRIAKEETKRRRQEEQHRREEELRKKVESQVTERALREKHNPDPAFESEDYIVDTLDDDKDDDGDWASISVFHDKNTSPKLSSRHDNYPTRRQSSGARRSYGTVSSKRRRNDGKRTTKIEISAGKNDYSHSTNVEKGEHEASKKTKALSSLDMNVNRSHHDTPGSKDIKSTRSTRQAADNMKNPKQIAGGEKENIPRKTPPSREDHLRPVIKSTSSYTGKSGMKRKVNDSELKLRQKKKLSKVDISSTESRHVRSKPKPTPKQVEVTSKKRSGVCAAINEKQRASSLKATPKYINVASKSPKKKRSAVSATKHQKSSSQRAKESRSRRTGSASRSASRSSKSQKKTVTSQSNGRRRKKVTGTNTTKQVDFQDIGFSFS